MLEVGQLAPDFSLPDAEMELFTLSKQRGKYVVLYFYPKDNAPSCVQQAIDFSDHEDDFLQNQAIIVGINRDDPITHANFLDKHGLSIALLSDSEGEVCEQYGVWQTKEVNGVQKLTICRSTFVIDKNGTLRYVNYCVDAKHHAADMLAFIKSLN